MNFGGGWCKQWCWWHGATHEREMDGSRSKNGPKRHTGYLWNAESKVYKMDMGFPSGSSVKRYEINFQSKKYSSWR